jgi:hypothetical protein
MKKINLIEVNKDKLENYKYLFEGFGHFENLLRFILSYTEPIIMVDSLNNPSYALLKHDPAIFLMGNPNEIDIRTIFAEFQKNSWIIPCSTEWDKYIMSHFAGKYEMHNRVCFDSSSLNLRHIRSLKTDLPKGMNIVPISAAHIEDKNGMIYQDLIRKFFNNHDFLKTGKGFALMDGELTVGYAASDNPIIGNNLELMFRVGYDNYTKYRNKGFGILLCVHFIEYCLENNLIPSWDAHNDISAHIATKLGYRKKKTWSMFKIL